MTTRCAENITYRKDRMNDTKAYYASEYALNFIILLEMNFNEVCVRGNNNGKVILD